ncbi:30S ribosomal protein S16 [Patescibacteria group bacterium]|nr:30S ribosomal protein S16 [Patescibacteria group bacterium]
MLRIRLSRVGKKNTAQFRITLADVRRSPTGKFIEILGHYNPHTKEKVFKKDRVEYWISKGAQPSTTVNNLLVDAGIIKGDKIKAWSSKKKEGDVKTEASSEKKTDEVKESNTGETK